MRNTPALSNSDNVTLLDVVEARGNVSRDLGVAFLESLVLLDVVEVVTTEGQCALHLGGADNTCHAHTTPSDENFGIFFVVLLTLEDSSTNVDISGERALLVDVSTLNGRQGSLEPKANVLVVSLLLSLSLAGKEHILLLLE